MLPKPTIAFRKRRCAQAGCECNADFSDPCAQCPNGNWGPMLCEGFYNAPKLSQNNNSLPSIESMAISITKSASKWIASGLKIADELTLKTRLNACRGCQHWNPKGFKGTGRCMKCGCSTWAKLRMATEKCPIGKW